MSALRRCSQPIKIEIVESDEYSLGTFGENQALAFGYSDVGVGSRLRSVKQILDFKYF
ncbi:unnamed protein product [Commensalibacter communis]|nr:unnamed protein product [Commensalibacter communis]